MVEGAAAMILRLSLDLPMSHAHLTLIRRLSRTTLEHLRVVEQDIADIETVVGELATNAVQYASRASEGRFRVELEYHAQRVMVLIVDHGPGFSPDEIAPPGTLRVDSETGEERFGGWGLSIAQSLTDHLDIQATDPQGTTVRAEKVLHYQNFADEEQARAMDQGGMDKGTKAVAVPT